MTKNLFRLLSFVVASFATTLFISPLLVSAQSAEFSVSVDSNSYLVRQTVEASFSAPPELFDRSDRIYLYNVTTGRIKTYKYTGSSPSGIIDFEIKDPGVYEFRYARSISGRPVVATSQQFIVSLPNSSLFNLSASPISGTIRETIIVSFSAPEITHSEVDQIQLYNVDTNRRIDSRSVGKSPSGTEQFIIDDSGVYEFRYILSVAGYPIMKTSEQITINLPNPTLYTLDAIPSHANSRELITVNYSSPENEHDRNDRIRLYNVDTNREISSVSVGDLSSGTKEFEIKDPGVYEFRYTLAISGNPVVKTSNQIKISLPSSSLYALTGTPSDASIREVISVAYSAPESSHNRSDKIRLYDVASGRQVGYQTVGDSPSGVKEFTIDNPGVYEFRYTLAISGYPVVSTSNKITVSLPDASLYSLIPNPLSTVIGDTVVVSYEAPAAYHSRSDRIELYNVNSERRISYQTVGDSPSGTKLFTIPTAGQYEFRYTLTISGYPVIAKSAEISVTLPDASLYALTISSDNVSMREPISVSYISPEEYHNRLDKILLFNIDTGRKVDSQYVGTSPSGIKEFIIEDPGQYEFRYVMYVSGNTVIRTSNPFIVTLPNSSFFNLSVSPEVATIREPITVSYAVPEIYFNRYDKIRLYNVDMEREIDTLQIGTSPSGTKEFIVKEPGLYEFRYTLAISGSPVVKKTNPFIVELPDPSNFILNVTDKSEIGRPIILSYSVPASHDPRDLIRLYNKETGVQVSRSYVGYPDSGTKQFIVDEVGVYEFRYTLYMNGTPVIQTSNEIEVVLLILDNITNFPLNSGTNIIALGDSITAGRDADDGLDYVSLLEDRIGIPIMNKGVIGDTTAEAYARLNADVLSQDPKLVIILLGGNNFLQNLPLEESFNNIENIINDIHSTGSGVLLLGIRDFFFADYDAEFRAVADATGAAYAPDILDGIIGNIFLTTDLVHPRNTGHRIIADRVEPYLDMLLQI